MEWDQLHPYATDAFNWFPNEHSQESLHFLYFGHEPYLPHLVAFLQSKSSFLGSDKGMTCLDKLQQAYMLVTLIPKKPTLNKIKTNMVMYQNIK